MTAPLRVAVLGATGRMGRELLKAIHVADDLVLSGAAAAEGDPEAGADCGALIGAPALGVTVSVNPAGAVAGADVAVDFTLAAATARNAGACAEAGVALVIGTTGLDRDGRVALDQASRLVPVMHASNMSVGVAVLANLTRAAATALGEAFDIEISESHHRAKRDAPSGTALTLGEAAAAGRGIELGGSTEAGRRSGSPARAPGAIGFASLRGGDIVGEHTVMFAGAGERVELSHIATDRGIFARGALRAARWIKGRQPGLYGMDDVLGLGEWRPETG